MRKKMWSLFMLLIMLISPTFGLYSNQPRFRSDNGHLCIESATNHNISLVTKGQGYINVNNENLLQIMRMAKDAWDAVESFRSLELPAFTDSMKNILPMIDGPKSLSNRVTALEMQMLNGTAMSLPTKGKGGTIPNARMATRLTNLEKKVTHLINLLSISECQSNPCQNGGTCMDLYNRFQCNCPHNWQGRLCELDVDECVRFANTDFGCQNGAECKNTAGSYECMCAPNWYGLHCTKKKNDCNSASSAEFCGNGVCINQLSAIGGYTCICNQGWTTDGSGTNSACTKDVDECKENKHTCSSNPPVDCKNTRGSFTCGNCPIGYEGDGFVCTDINECLVDNGGCSKNPKVQCINTRGSFKCESCPPGYSGDGHNCLYVAGGVCAINNGGCHPKADCTVYAETTIQCTCREGYKGSGFGTNGCIVDSASVDYCANRPCGSHGLCIADENHGFSCSCNRGFTGRTCNISSENACFENPCLNGDCVPGIEPSDFSCKCRPGYFGRYCEIVLEACGGYLSSDSGMIRYPEANTSLTYESNLNCGWTIEVNSSFVVNLTFIWMDVEKSIKCSYDYVEIINDDDEEGLSLGKFCGNNSSMINSTISNSNVVIVRFHTDKTKNFRGFQLNYTSILPKCGFSIDIDSHGSLSSPGSPGKYPNNRDCYWTLNAKPGKRIQFNFFSLQFEQHINCSFDYLEIRDGFTHHSPILVKLCNTTIPPPIYTLGAHAVLYFHSDYYGQDYGFQLTYTVIEGIPGCGGIYTSSDGIISSPTDLSSDSSNYLDNLNCEWHIRMPHNQKIKLSFIKKFGIETSKNCSLDFLEIYDGPNLRSPIIGRYCGSDRFYQPIITNSNEVTLFFKSDFAGSSEGFKIKYEVFCGGTFTENRGIIESPFYPNPYPNNKECIYIISQPVGKAIRLSFLNLDIEDLSYPKCLYDSLEIRDGDNENSTKIAILCGNIEKIPKLPYISTHNYMWLKFSTDHSNTNKGFRANYSTIDMGCGGILKDFAGIIQSTKHPDQYLHNQMCKWIISVNETSQIQVTWLTFSLEPQQNCNNDYVEIYDNSISGNASKIGRYCGTKVPPVLTSMGNRLTILFKTDHSVAFDGFMLSYNTLNKSQTCGGNFFTSEGFIKSPNFPEDYPKLKDCIWTVTVPVFRQIELNISEFLLEESFDCRFDFLEIRNGAYSTSPLIGKYCGSKILPVISSLGNSLFIRFVSDGSRGRKGFFIEWYTTNKGCGGTLNSGVGHIVSPNYPLPVHETLECFYKIAVAQGNQIQLNIVDLELTTDSLNGGTCKDDFLEVYDGGNTASKSLGTFCFDNHSASFVHSSSNQMYIKFRSSGFSKGRGFSLKYSTDCNVTLNGYQGAIEIARQENMRTDKCRWTILAPKGNKVNITFTSFKMISSRLKNFAGLRHLVNNECNNTHLTISEGADIHKINTVLWNHCMDDPPPIISSTKSIVRINYMFRNKLSFLDKFDTFRLEWITDGCGGTLNKYRETFTSPGYPGFYPSSVSCEWKIITDYGNTIQIIIEDFSFETSRNCVYDSLAIYSGADDTGSELLRICHKQKNPITVTSGGNEVFVRFESDDQSQSKGFKASYIIMGSKCGGKFTAPQGTIHSINYPKNYDSSSSCMWYIEIEETHLVNLTFVDFSTRNFPATNRDSVLVYDGDINGKLLLNHSGNSIPPPIISSSNKLLVAFEVGKQEIRAKGFKAIYSTACGAKLITNESGIISSDSLAYDPSSKNCSWTIISGIPESKVTLTFTHIDIIHYLEYSTIYQNETNVECSNNMFHTILRILDGPDSGAPEIMKFCKSYPIPGPIVSNGPSMRIEYTDNSNSFDSFMATYSVRSTACGGSYDAIRGTISTPNYPNNYLRDSECVWILKSSVGNRVSINFISFELEENEFCNEVYVEVREQNITGPHLGTFCGSNIPPNNISASSLWIKFRSGSLGSAKGFTADFHYATDNYLIQKSGEISSPNYPIMYRNVDDYSWTIAVDEGKRVQIIIKELTVTSAIHHLKIYDGSNFESLVLFEQHTSDNENVYNKTIISSVNIVLIKLIAGSKSMFGINFFISWTQIDQLYSKMLYPEFEMPKNQSSNDYYLSPSTNTSLIITSPGYPYGYAPNLHVVWTIHTEPHHHLEIELIDVDLSPVHSSSDTVLKDYITVETVDTAGVTTFKKTVKTKQVDNKTIVGKNKVIITFISNNALNGTGFKAEAKLQCGGELSGPNGLIYISSSTVIFEPDQICTWNVTVRSGKTISVKIIDMKLFPQNTCSDRYALFKNGFYEDSSLVGQGKFCNMTNVTELSTTDNKLQVQVKISTEEMIKIAYEEKSTTCGGQIYISDLNNFTEITSPSYPNIPPPHIECIWTVVAPAGERLFVNIEDINLKTGEQCRNEYVEFRNGASRFSSLIKRICQYFDVQDIETTDNFLYIKYFTDLNVPSNGFKLNVSIAKCGGTRRAPRGTIASPNFPGSYEQNMDCEYRIIVDVNYRVSLNFETLNLKRRYLVIGNVNETYNDTYDDSLTIYDVDPLNNNRILLTKVFGSSAPATPITSSGRELVIKFKSQIKNGPYNVKNSQPKFLINYWIEFNNCDKHFDAINGRIDTPTISLHVSKLRCVYTIQVPRGRRITAHLHAAKSIVPPCENQSNIVLNNNISGEKVQVYLGTMYNHMMCINSTRDTWDYNNRDFEYESTMNEMTVIYEYLGGNQQGFSLIYTSNNPSLCGGTIDASINKGQLVLPIQNVTTYFCQWDFINTNGTTVIAANFKVNESEVSCQFYKYTLIATNQDEDLALKTYCLTSNTNEKFLILSPLPMTKLLIRGYSKEANYRATIDYSFNSCGGIIQGQKITITSPNYPKNYQQNTNCAWAVNLPEGGVVNVYFNGLDLESPCDNNYVMLYDGPGPESPVLGKYCGNILPETFVATSTEIWVVFSSINENSSRKGFNLTLESVKIGCGKVYVSENGEISSTNYPKLYPNNDECEWTIAVWPGNRVNLQFVERFYLEQSVNCTKDYVQISDYVNNTWVPVGNRLCGRHMPPTITSTETKLKVRIRTDDDIQGDGFKAIWNSLCDGIFTQKSGKIISPNYPRIYPNDIKCNYTIYAPGQTIRLVFKSFELEDSRCKYDNLTIYDKVSTFSNQAKHLIGSYCGTRVPKTLNILNSVMMIFITDSSSNKKGFEIHYDLLRCGDEITTPGLLKSPSTIDEFTGYSAYPPNENCTWTIRAPPGQVVQLVFTKFRLEPSSIMYDEEEYEKCPYDVVYVYEESDLKNNDTKSINEFCGIMDDMLPDVQSKTNTLYVQFITDSSRNNEGFVAEVSFSYGESKGCGGTLRLNQTNSTSSYTLKAPKLPTRTNLDCGWLILVPPSFIVQIQVISYKETPKCPLNTTDCRCSSIQFLDGPGRMSSKIRQFCPENTDNPLVTSSGSEAYLRYIVFDTDLDVNFEIKITPVTSICGPKALLVTNNTQVLTSPNYPLPYGYNLVCTWNLELNNSNRFIFLHFIDMDLEETKDCSSNYLEVYYNQWESFYSTTFRLCHEDHKFDILTQKLIGPVKLKLYTNGQKASRGFKLEYKSKICQSTYNNSNGRIYFELGHDTSTDVFECTFTINLQQPNLTISAYFSTAYFFSSTANYLKVYDGSSVSSPLVTTSGKSGTISSPVFSTGPSLTMSYRTTIRWSTSLDISYTSTDQGRGCGGRMLNVEGMVTSPLYPFIYRKIATCRWDIAVPRQHAISIAFRVFDLGDRKSCETNYLEMYNVDQLSGESSFVAKYCGGDNPALHISQTGAVFIRYVTTVHNTGTGWVLNFKLKQNL